MTFDITPIMEAGFTLIGALVTAFLIPYIKSKTTDAQRKEMLEWVKIAVAAAEQIYKGQGHGEEKKQYVIQWLSDHGITADYDKLDMMIEAVVNQLNGGKLSAGQAELNILEVVRWEKSSRVSISRCTREKLILSA